jgi:hypothetical protein
MAEGAQAGPPTRGDALPPRARTRSTAAARGVIPARRGELVSGVCAVVLVVTLLVFAWYGADGVPHPALAQPRQYALGAFATLGPLAILALASALVALALLAAHIAAGSRASHTASALVLTLLGGASALGLIYRVLIVLPQPRRVVDAKLGAVIGLMAAIGLWLGAIESLRARRVPARRGPSARVRARREPSARVCARRVPTRRPQDAEHLPGIR